MGRSVYNNLYEGVIVPTALYGAVALGMRSAKRRKVNVFEMKHLRSLVGVLRMDRVRNEEVENRADQKVLRWFGHVKIILVFRDSWKSGKICLYKDKTIKVLRMHSKCARRLN